jgi:UDP-N-acetylmuramate dehydrogenase
MNAGGHGSDMAAVLLDVEIADLTSDDPDRMVRTVAAEALDLGFRRSGLKAQDLVLSARLQLARGDRAESERTISEIVTWRREHQPGGQNAGSVFVNPVPGEVSAGALVDDLGLRGFRLGTATVSEKHANFIQADENGSADDVLRLMVMVRERVAAATGFDLRTEIRLIGFENVEDD